MAWSEQWSIKIDGVEWNGGSYVTQIPDIENDEQDPVLVPIDGRGPAFIRTQPKEATYTVLIAVKDAGTWAAWAARRTAIRAGWSIGAHTLTVQIRGMAAPVSTTVIVRGRMFAAVERRAVITVVAPVPLPV